MISSAIARFLTCSALVVCLIWPRLALANDWQAFAEPGAFAIMRHALAPGTGDPAGFTVGDCTTQRNLNDAGRDQARRIGAALRERGIVFDAVLSSQWCRCRETAELLDLAPVSELAAFNSFFRDFDARDARTQTALRQIAQRQGRPFIVTHQVNISALTGQGTRSGEVLVVRQAEGGLEVLGRIMIDP